MKRNLTIWVCNFIVCSFFLFSAQTLTANNIEVSNVSLTGQNTSNQTVLVQFDLSWENSWRISVGPSNWDAAWVFVKFRQAGGAWQHANLNYVNGTAASDGHTEPAGGRLTTPADGRGVFVYRDADGSGDISLANIQLLWNYGTNGVPDGQLVDVQVFAIEMVYVPQGNFSLGDGTGSTSANRFYAPPFGFSYTINSENAITVGGGFGNLFYNSVAGSNAGDQTGTVFATFPKGYNAFYCMKYEASQGQYVDFFNTLTETQKTDRDITNANHKNTDGVVARNTIAYVSGSATTTTPDRALNYVSNDDALAYMDWAGLRMMTEFEFEKACRGTQPAVANEFAWGTANIYAPAAPYTMLSDGTPSASIGDPGTLIGNAFYQTTASGFGGPARCGIFAASAVNKTREETGGSYYGIMELTGNLYERTVSIGTPGGRSYTGLHGDGLLTQAGAHDVGNWPGVSGGDIGYRGGSYANGSDYLRVSDRFDAATPSNITNSRIGFRAVRTAP